MVIGVLTLNLYLEDAFSLKDKRHIVKSLIERIRNRFNASVAETDLNDVWKNAVISVVCVSNDSSHIDSMLSNIVEFAQNDGRFFIENYSTEKIF
ncbi:MAG: DUF503 domain-containing protein [Oscillospiraceae bacterium]|nr:DUF503 domain-containing protein [Oscillospiraceae bacterium]